MKRLEIAFAIVILLGTAACSPRNNAKNGKSPCRTSVVVIDPGNGVPLLGEPPRLVCEAGQDLDITFHDDDGDKSHKFEIPMIQCKVDPTKKYNPVKDFVGNSSDDINGGGTGHLKKVPQMLSTDEISKLKCSADLA